jgi:hypothetical protein
MDSVGAPPELGPTVRFCQLLNVRAPSNRWLHAVCSTEVYGPVREVLGDHMDPVVAHLRAQLTRQIIDATRSWGSLAGSE